ncbi:ABC transporter permease [Gloeobacter kilaueensis]|uniref:Macrolide transporter ATP-binding /permease protein n=1 Tax=Gloeobacter kilaueensis (strain ATCC BAA-2537 / CCAP 1431/1 / ULC 316 / JS1) TaxID=1183438 RepID=U5QQQ7_GLOK1|nr:ABC transporter permease [Gloeobacter kilaueensis]AGY59954.1 macrolide transporter ATP-binding /permease protein [Gloeobacter kilaueensis JS1]
MPWYENLRVAAVALWANRLRSVLTMLGLIIGVSSVILIVAIGVGAQKFVKDQFRGFGTNVVIVGEDRFSKSARPLTMADMEAMRTQIGSVDRVSGMLAQTGRAIWGNKDADCRIYGLQPELASILNWQMEKGRFFTDREVRERAHVTVVGTDLAQELFGYEDPVGKQILVNHQPMTVIGVTGRQTAFKGYLQYVERGTMIPLTVVQESLITNDTPFGKSIGLIFLQTKPGETIEAVTFQVINLLRARHQITAEDDFFVANAQEILNVFNTIAAALTVMLGFIAAISLLVGGINIMNIMLVSVKERTREIGLRKAVGASEEVILIQFVIEAILISIVGGAVGIAFGWAAAALVGVATPLKPEVTPVAVAIAVAVATGVGLFFGVFPARQAARLDPIVALRTE